MRKDATHQCIPKLLAGSDEVIEQIAGNVCFWQKAEIPTTIGHVRFRGQEPTSRTGTQGKGF